MGRKQQIINLFRDISGLSAVRWHARKPGLYCFNYHSIGSAEQAQFDPNVISCTQERFAEHVAFLKRYFTIIDVNTLLELQASQAEIDKPLAVITFDDGYLDNYRYAFPILKQHQASAIFFVSTQHIDGNQLFWWDQVAWMLRNSKQQTITLAGSEPLDLLNLRIETAIHRTLKVIKRDHTTPISRYLELLAEQTSCALDSPPAASTMSWEMLREMQQAGMDIGSHTCSHRILSHLSREQQQQELAESKQILEQQLGKPIEVFAYPVGGLDAYTEETRQLLQETGYKLAFNYVGYTNADLKQPFELGRLAVDENIQVNDLKRQIAFAPMRGGL